MKNYSDPDIINIGTGKDISIADLALLIKDIVGFRGRINFDTEKPDGTPRKVVDVSRLNSMGWKAKTSLMDGIEKTYSWFCGHYDYIRKI